MDNHHLTTQYAGSDFLVVKRLRESFNDYCDLSFRDRHDSDDFNSPPVQLAFKQGIEAMRKSVE